MAGDRARGGGGGALLWAALLLLSATCDLTSGQGNRWTTSRHRGLGAYYPRVEDGFGEEYLRESESRKHTTLLASRLFILLGRYGSHFSCVMSMHLLFLTHVVLH